MDISKIISSARLKLGKTMNVIETLTGVLASNQSKIELGNNKNPGFLTVGKLAEFYKLDLNEMYKATLNENSDALIFSGVELPIKIPVLSIEESEKWINGDRTLITEDTEIKNSPEPCSEQSFLLTVKDDSMTSFAGGLYSFPLGSRIVVDPKVNYKNNSFVIVKFEEDQSIEFRQVVMIGKRVIFKCINTQYQILTTTQDHKILGSVIAMYNKV